MKVKLTQREIEYILFLIGRFAEFQAEKDFENEYSQEDFILIDKLENALRILEVENSGILKNAGNKILN